MNQTNIIPVYIFKSIQKYNTNILLIVCEISNNQELLDIDYNANFRPMILDKILPFIYNITDKYINSYDVILLHFHKYYCNSLFTYVIPNRYTESYNPINHNLYDIAITNSYFKNAILIEKYIILCKNENNIINFKLQNKNIIGSLDQHVIKQQIRRFIHEF
jgi:hypothetical protein